MKKDELINCIENIYPDDILENKVKNAIYKNKRKNIKYKPVLITVCIILVIIIPASILLGISGYKNNIGSSANMDFAHSYNELLELMSRLSKYDDIREFTEESFIYAENKNDKFNVYFIAVGRQNGRLISYKFSNKNLYNLENYENERYYSVRIDYSNTYKNFNEIEEYLIKEEKKLKRKGEYNIIKDTYNDIEYIASIYSPDPKKDKKTFTPVSNIYFFYNDILIRVEFLKEFTNEDLDSFELKIISSSEYPRDEIE